MILMNPKPLNLKTDTKPQTLNPKPSTHEVASCQAFETDQVRTMAEEASGCRVWRACRAQGLGFAGLLLRKFKAAGLLLRKLD